MRLRHLAAAGLAACSFASQGAVVFSDDFEGATLGLNIAPTGWTVQNGTVDVVSDATFPGLCTTGKCVDLDGSTSDAGVLISRQLDLLGGVDYLLTFDLSGNRRNAPADLVTVTFGSGSMLLNLPSSAPNANHSLAFSPTADGAFTLSFSNAGGDNIGALLDNVVVTSSVPEPGSAALALLALGGLAAARRRKP